MLRVDSLQPISANQRVAEVAIRFLRHEVLPVCDKDSRCVGLLFPRDCSQVRAEYSSLSFWERGSHPRKRACRLVSNAGTSAPDSATDATLVVSQMSLGRSS